jgi:hypothetical protein
MTPLTPAFSVTARGATTTRSFVGDAAAGRPNALVFPGAVTALAVIARPPTWCIAPSTATSPAPAGHRAGFGVQPDVPPGLIPGCVFGFSVCTGTDFARGPPDGADLADGAAVAGGAVNSAVTRVSANADSNAVDAR